MMPIEMKINAVTVIGVTDTMVQITRIFLRCLEMLKFIVSDLICIKLF